MADLAPMQTRVLMMKDWFRSAIRVVSRFEFWCQFNKVFFSLSGEYPGCYLSIPCLRKSALAERYHLTL